MPYLPHLRDFRVRCGLSQAALSRKAGVDRATISRCENGYFVMDVKCVALENAFRDEAAKRGVSVTTLTIMEGGKIGEFPPKKKKILTEAED